MGEIKTKQRIPLSQPDFVTSILQYPQPNLKTPGKPRSRFHTSIFSITFLIRSLPIASEDLSFSIKTKPKVRTPLSFHQAYHKPKIQPILPLLRINLLSSRRSHTNFSLAQNFYAVVFQTAAETLLPDDINHRCEMPGGRERGWGGRRLSERFCQHWLTQM